MKIIYIQKKNGFVYYDPMSRFGCSIEDMDKPFIFYMKEDYNYKEEKNFKILEINNGKFDELIESGRKRDKSEVEKILDKHFLNEI
jgi:hypothetical protein